MMRRFALALAAVSMGVTAIGCAGTRVDGTYMLVSRTLPDGSVQTPPTVNGLMTFSDGVRNTNVHWITDQGRNASSSSAADFGITEFSYSETNRMHVINAPGDGGLSYDLTEVTGTSEIVYTERGMRFELPLHDEPTVEFGDDGFIATRVGEFVDMWRKVSDVRDDEAKALAAEEKAARDAAAAEAQAAADTEAKAAADAEAAAAEDAAADEDPQK